MENIFRHDCTLSSKNKVFNRHLLTLFLALFVFSVLCKVRLFQDIKQSFKYNTHHNLDNLYLHGAKQTYNCV